MNLGRIAAAALTVSVLFGADAQAGNGSNYVHLTNGIDYFFGKTPPAGAFTGIWRCFPADMLYSPTRVVDAASPDFPNYAAKVCAIHVAISASAGKQITFPTISLSSGDGDCRFIQSGLLNFGLATVAGIGTVLVGPTNGTVTNLLAVLGNTNLANPFAGPGTVFIVTLNLTQLFGTPSTITVPENEALTLWVQDDPNQFGPGTMQYFSGSNDERNVCSSYSFLLSGNGTAFSLVGTTEWAIGTGLLDATGSTFVSPSVQQNGGANTHQNGAGGVALLVPFDQGSGTRDISLTGTDTFGSLGSEILGFTAYDEGNVFGGGGRLTLMNVQGFDFTFTPFCETKKLSNPNYLAAGSGGVGGPVLALSMPQQPRFTGSLDTLALALLGNPIWTAATIHNTATAGGEIAWFPAPAAIAGSTGNNGGFPIPIPPLPTILGIDFLTWQASLNGSGTALGPQQNNGHSNGTGYSFTFTN